MINRNLIRDEQGASAIEYAIIMALIAVSLVAALTSLGESTSNTYSRASAGMAGPAKAAPEAATEPPPARVPVRGGGDNRVRP